MHEMLALVAFGEHQDSPHRGFCNPRRLRWDNRSSEYLPFFLRKTMVLLA